MYKSLFLILVFIFPSTAFADDPPAMLKYVKDGKEYVCFLPVDAQTLLQYRMDIPELKLDLKKHKDLLKVKDLQIEKLTSANGTLLNTKHFLITENVRLQKEVDNRNAWYKSPYLWCCFGLVVGTAATVAVVYLVK